MIPDSNGLAEFSGKGTASASESVLITCNEGGGTAWNAETEKARAPYSCLGDVGADPGALEGLELE